METRNEKWQSLRLEAQKFVPQENVAACWELSLDCDGIPKSQANQNYEDHIFHYPGSSASDFLGTTIGHEHHHITTLYTTTPSEADYPSDDVLAGMVGEFHSIVATEEGMKVGQDIIHPNKPDHWTEGYCFTVEGTGYPYCFVYSELTWTLRGNGSGPNASN